MSVFVDTSLLYALLDEDDANHESAVRVWRRAVDDERLWTHAYVVVEASALVQRRLGMRAARRLHRALLPVVAVEPVDAATLDRAVERWLGSSSRGRSLVDVTSFVAMADRGSTVALAFDRDFEEAGFTLWT